MNPHIFSYRESVLKGDFLSGVSKNLYVIFCSGAPTGRTVSYNTADAENRKSLICILGPQTTIRAIIIIITII
jgi:hypothetical protein